MNMRDHDPAETARCERQGFRVSDDLADMPVSDAELDVIEAFLMKQFKAVMAGESPEKSELTPTQDSQLSQTHAEIAASKRSQGARR